MFVCDWVHHADNKWKNVVRAHRSERGVAEVQERV